MQSLNGSIIAPLWDSSLLMAFSGSPLMERGSFSWGGAKSPEHTTIISLLLFTLLGFFQFLAFLLWGETLF
jgi:hypothetical protein